MKALFVSNASSDSFGRLESSFCIKDVKLCSFSSLLLCLDLDFDLDAVEDRLLLLVAEEMDILFRVLLGDTTDEDVDVLRVEEAVEILRCLPVLDDRRLLLFALIDPSSCPRPADFVVLLFDSLWCRFSEGGDLNERPVARGDSSSHETSVKLFQDESEPTLSRRDCDTWFTLSALLSLPAECLRLRL